MYNNFQNIQDTAQLKFFLKLTVMDTITLYLIYSNSFLFQEVDRHYIYGLQWMNCPGHACPHLKEEYSNS